MEGLVFCFVLTVHQIIWTCVIGNNKLLIVSMDGFRWDYTDKVDTPNFDWFRDTGTCAEYIKGTFITNTFPSHYTIATGLYEENHGIVANFMYDPKFDEYFNKGTKDTKWWKKGEPIWVTAAKNNLRSATFFWPGSEVKLQGYRPNIYEKYNGSVPFKTRIDTVVDWLSLPRYDIDFAMLYFNEPDHTGHVYGPDSQQVKDEVKYMDSLLGYLIEKFTESGLWDSVNVIVTSDHGMAYIDVATKYIDILDYIDPRLLLHSITSWPVASLNVPDDMIDAVVQNLTGIDHLQVYRRQDVPAYWHYSNNRRILDIVLVADEGWTIVKNITEWYKGLKGQHGYDNRLMSMKTIFYAKGPNIRSGYDARPFNAVDIYPLMCELLGITPASNDGELANTKWFTEFEPPCQPC